MQTESISVCLVWKCTHVNEQSQRTTPNFTFPLSNDCVAVHHYISAQRNVKLIWSRCSPSEKMVLSVRNADLASVCRETNLGTNAEHFESCFYQMFETLDSWLQQKLTSTLQSSVWLPIMVCKAFFIQLTSLCKKCKRNVAGLFLALMSLWILLVWFSAFFGSCCATIQDLLAFKVTNMGMKIDICSLRFRVVYLQVSMNEGLSFITSSVHITTTECVSLNTNTATQTTKY